MLEGLCSLGLFAVDLAAGGRRPVAERQHTEYDAELGWINRPSLSIPDLYGPGRSLHTNSLCLRATCEYQNKVAPGVVRLLCSGDSFTLGYGLDDQDTWCAKLESRRPGLGNHRFGHKTRGQGEGGNR